MNKILKIILLSNIIIFLSYLIFDIYQYLSYYQYEQGLLQRIQPCGLFNRLIHYFLSLLIIIGSFSYLQKRKGILIVLIGSFGFIFYFIFEWILPFIAYRCHICYINIAERVLIIYLYLFFEILLLLKFVFRLKKNR